MSAADGLGEELPGRDRIGAGALAVRLDHRHDVELPAPAELSPAGDLSHRQDQALAAGSVEIPVHRDQTGGVFGRGLAGRPVVDGALARLHNTNLMVLVMVLALERARVWWQIGSIARRFLQCFPSLSLPAPFTGALSRRFLARDVVVFRPKPLLDELAPGHAKELVDDRLSDARELFRGHPNFPSDPSGIVRQCAARRPPAQAKQAAICAIFLDTQVRRSRLVIVDIERHVGVGHRTHSDSNLAPFDRLHDMQAQARFSSLSSPPRATGTMWSASSGPSIDPQ